MRFRFLSHNTDFARSAHVAGKFSALALAAVLGVEGMIAGPLHAAPTLGGDESGPKVRILQPNYQDVLKGKTGILIAVQASKFNPEFVEILVDDKVILTPTRLADFPSARFDWDTKVFTDGPHKLTVRVTDTQGFRGWAEVVVYINNLRKPDNTPPSLSWLNVKPYQQLSGTAKIQLDAMDNFGVKWIIVAVNPDVTPTQKPPLRSWMISRPPYVINFDTTTLPDGLYRLSAQAWDSREQEGVAPGLTVGIVNNPIVSTTMVADTLEALRLSEIASSGQRTSPARSVAAAGPTASVPTATAQTATAQTATVPDRVEAKPVGSPVAEAAKTPSAPTTVLAKNYPAGPGAPEAPAGRVSARNPRSGVRSTVENSPGAATIVEPRIARQGRATAPASVETEARPLPRVAAVEAAPRVGRALPAAGPSRVQRATMSSVPAAPTSVASAPSFPNVDTKVAASAVSRPAAASQVQPALPRVAARTEVPLAPPALSTFGGPVMQGNSGAASVATPTPTLAVGRLAGRIVSPDNQARKLEEGAAGNLSSQMAERNVGSASRIAAPMGEARIASLRSAAPQQQSRDVAAASGALLSGSVNVGRAAVPTLLAGALRPELKTTFEVPGKVDSPSMESRIFLGSPIMSGARREAGSRISTPEPLKVAADVAYGSALTGATAPDGVSRPVGTLAARGKQLASGLVGPLLTTLSKPASLFAAGRVAPEKSVTANTVRARVARPELTAEAPVAKAKGPLLSRLPASAGRPQKNADHAAAAITVSPMEVSTGRTLPTFHLVKEEANLAAVAARYGLPVQVLAHCNNLDSKVKLVSGTRLKLPRELQIQYKGEAVTGDVASMLVGSTSVTGFRFLWEKQGGKLEWDAARQRVIAKNGKHEILLSVGSHVATVDKKEVMMDMAAFLMAGRTMVPVRLFEEGLRAQVEWEPETGRMYVAMAN